MFYLFTFDFLSLITAKEKKIIMGKLKMKTKTRLKERFVIVVDSFLTEIMSQLLYNS